MTDEERAPIDCGCKIGRVAQRHGLGGIDEELSRLWLGDGPGERRSVRALADYFNERVLAAHVESTDADVLPLQVEYIYDVITSGDVDEDEVSEVRANLREYGVDVETVTADEFVSYQTVHNHLTGCLGLSSPTDATNADSAATGRDALRALQRRVEVVAEDIVDRQDSDGTEGINSLEVDVSVTVGCSECGYSRSVGRYVADGGSCYCEPDSGWVPDSDGDPSQENTPLDDRERSESSASEVGEPVDDDPDESRHYSVDGEPKVSGGSSHRSENGEPGDRSREFGAGLPRSWR